MVSRLLGACGLYLGEADDLRRSAPDNPEGHWENSSFVALNDAILAEMGGTWHLPPVLPDCWESAPGLGALVGQGVELVERHRGREPWGWKDPRNCLTYAFWRRVVPDARVVVCVRNPVEVARSLALRNEFSEVFGLSLWQTYMDALMRFVPEEARVVTHYESYFFDPRRELDRVAGLLGLSVDDDVIADAVGSISRTLRHHEASGVPVEVEECYARLCAAAGPVYRAIGAAREAESAALVRDLSSRLEDARRSAESLAADVAARDATVADLTTRLDAAEGTVRDLTERHDRFVASFAGRLLERYGQFKHRYLLPLFQTKRRETSAGSATETPSASTRE